MHFSLIDKILTLEPGKSVVATKTLTMAEEYLRDHFPNFPVMPGVLMLEALTQASAWLIRVSDDFAHSMVLLKEAKNVKYGKFVQPGQTILISATIIDQTEELTTLKAEGSMNGQTNLRATLTLRRYNLTETRPERKKTDEKVINKLKNELALLWSDYPEPQ